MEGCYKEYESGYAMKTPSKKVNIKIVVYSIIALIFVALTFLVDWKFIIGAAILMWLNQIELTGKK